MESTNNTKSQENVDDSTNINLCSNPAEDSINSSHVPAQTGGSGTTGTGSGKRTQEPSSDDNGSDLDNGEEAKREENEELETGHERSLRNVDEKKRVEEAMEEIQKKQKTHDLYCSNCTHNITQTALLFEKGKETFPYDKEGFVLWFVVVISFKYPFIYIPWLYNNNTRDDPKLPRVETFRLRFLLVVVLLLLSAIVLWVLPSQPPSPPHILDGPTPPSPPQPNRNSTPIDKDGGGFTFFPSVRFLSAISFLLLAILALRWPSISREKPTNVTTNQDGGEAQIHTTKPVDEKEADPSTPGIKVNVPGTEPDNSQPETPAKRLENLLKHIVVPVKKLFPTELDILKSIVYGGLIESITSLGVVTSAVGSGASTLNILALGIANLFSGLSLIIYNLHALIKDLPRFDGPNNDHMQKLAAECYMKLLGNKDKVILHCIVVVVSFIFFGVIPPLSYGLSFKITNKGRYEQVLVVVAASLVCVIFLSFAKAYAFGMAKRKTVAEYTGMAIGASGLSFITCQYVRDLLEKYDFQKLASE